MLKTSSWFANEKTYNFTLFKPLWTLSYIKCAAVTEFWGKKTSCYLNIDFVRLEMTFHNINTRSYRSKWDFIRLGSHKLCGCHRWYILVDSCDPLMPNREQRKRGRWHRLCLALAWQSSYVEHSTANTIRVHKYIFLLCIGPWWILEEVPGTEMSEGRHKKCWWHVSTPHLAFSSHQQGFYQA